MAEDLGRELDDRLRAYYAAYYRDTLGLPDWDRRMTARLAEQAELATPILDWLTRWTGIRFEGRRVLVVGAGTGAESMALTKAGSKVVALEPSIPALEILGLRKAVCLESGLEPVGGLGEQLPFQNGAFGVIYCFAVLEHTREPFACLDEMLRVLEAGGFLFLELPDYRFPYEGHYKLPWIPFLPRPLRDLFLRLRGRPSDFANTLQFLTFSGLRRYCDRRAVPFMRYFAPLPAAWKRRTWFWRLAWHYAHWFGILPKQTIILRKPDGTTD